MAAGPFASVHVTNNLVYGPNTGAAANGNGIEVTGDGSVVSGNEVHNVHLNSIDWSGSGIIVANGSNITVEDNIVDGADSGISVTNWDNTLGMSNISILNNHVSNASDEGISIQSAEGEYFSVPSGPIASLTVTGNTVTDSVSGLGIWDYSTNHDGDWASTVADISGNTFARNTTQISTDFTSGDLTSLLGSNSFDASAIDTSATNAIYGDLQTAVGEASIGDTLDVAGTFVTNGQVDINKDLTIAGNANARAAITSGTDMAGTDEASAWILVGPNVTFSLSNVVIDGSGHAVYQALRNEGDTTVDNVDFENIGVASDYVGEAIESFGGYVVGGAGADSNPVGSAAASLTVSNSTFENIGRIGILVKGEASTANISGITYTGKGAGDWLDYGVEFGAGGTGTVSDSTITGALGITSNDGSTSAGIQVTSYYGPGTQATIENNTITGNWAAVDVGYDGSDTSIVHASGNDFSGNTHGVDLESAQATADFSGNWWGTTNANTILTSMTGANASSVDVSPFLMSGTDTSSATGFQGDFSDLTVTASGGGDANRIQEGVSDVTAGGTVNVGAGTYEEQVAIAKNLTLSGAGEGVTTIEAPDTLATSFTAEGAPQHAIVSVENTSGVTISGLTVDGLGKGDTNGNLIGVSFYDASGTVNGVHITNIYDAINGGNQEGYGVAVYNDQATPQTVTVENSLIDHFQKNGIAFRGTKMTAVVEGNTITGIGDTTGAAQNGVELYDNLSGGRLVSGTIEGNTISGISYASTDDYATGIYLINTNDVLVQNNSVTGTGTGAASYGVAVLGSDNVTLDTNTLSDLQRGVSLYDQFYGSGGTYAGFGPDNGVTITHGNLSGNDTGLFTNSAFVTGLDVSGVSFSGNAVQFQGSSTDLPNVLANNTFDATAVDANVGDTIYGDLQTAIGAAGANDTLDVAGTFVTTGQVEIAHNLNITGLSGARATISSGTDQTGGDEASAWILVDPNVTFNLSNVVIDGSSHTVYQALRNEGDTTVDNVDFHDIGTPADYVGEAIESFGGMVAGGAGSDSNVSGSPAATLSVTNSTFENIGRIGILVKGDGSTADITGNTYTGKGAGDWLDYGIEVGAGGFASIHGNTITGALGVASSDGSTSAGVEITTFYGAGTKATIGNNTITGNTAAVDVGYDDPTTSADDDNDTSTVTAFNNNFSGNGVELESNNTTADFTGNYWGTTNDATILGKMTGLRAGSVNFSSFLANGTDTDPASLGFQGDFANLIVTSLGGGTDRLGEAVAEASAGGTINVNAGTYALSNTLLIDKALSLVGAGEGTTTIDHTGIVSDIYAMRVRSDDVSLSGFTLTSYAGISVNSQTSDILHNTSISNITVDTLDPRGTGVSIFQTDGATLDHVTVDGTNSGGDNGVQIIDAADVSLTNVHTFGNGTGLFIAENGGSVQLNNIDADTTNTFEEAAPVVIADFTAGAPGLGSVNIQGFQYAIGNEAEFGSAPGQLSNNQQNAIDAAAALGASDSTVQGWAGTGVDNIFTVGTSTGGTALSINTAINAASAGGVINVNTGTYAENVLDNAKQLAFNFGDSGVTSFTLTAGAAGSSLSGNLSATGAIIFNVADSLSGTFTAGSIALNGATTLLGDTTLDTSAAKGSVVTASVDGAKALTVKAASASLGNLGATTRLAAVSDSAATTLTGTTYDAASLNFGGALILAGDTTLGATNSVTTGSVDGAHALTVKATTASLGNLGATTRLGAVSDNATTTLTGTTYNASGLNFGGALILAGDTTLDATNSVTTGSVDGAHALAVKAATASLGNLGATTRLGAVSDNATTTLTGTTYDAASLNFGGALILAGDTTLDATGAVVTGSVDGTKAGAQALAVKAATASLGNLGAKTALGAVSDNAATTLTGTTYNANSFGFGALTLTGNTTLTATGAVAAGSVDGTTAGAQGLAVTAAAASLGNLGAKTALGVVSDTGATTLTGTTYNANSFGFGALTLTGNTTLTATGAVAAGSVDGTKAGAQALTVTAAAAALGNLGATTRLGAVSDNAATTLTGNTYDANSFGFGGGLTLTAASTTLNTTQSATAAGDIVFGGDIFGTANGGQSLVLIAGPGTGAASANGNISLQNAGTLSNRLNNLTVSGNNFTALTVDMAGNFNSILTGNQVFAADTLNALGSANSNVAGNAAGHINASGNVAFNVGGNLGGTISGQNVNVQAGTISNANITGSQSIDLTAQSVSGTALTAPTVSGTAATFDATVTASNTASITANTIGGTFTGGTVTLLASNSVDANVSSTNLNVTAPQGTVTGTWTQLSSNGSGTLNVNGQTTVGTGSTNPNQLVVEGFVLPAGSSISSSGELILPEGVVLGLLSPGGNKKPKVILVHDVRQLGALLASGYTAIVIDLSGNTKTLPTKLAMN